MYSPGNLYGIPEGIFYSYPVEVADGKWKIVQGLNVSEEQKKRLAHTTEELLEEKKAIQHLLKV